MKEGWRKHGMAAPESDIDIMVLVDTDAEGLKGYEDKLCDVSTAFALEYFKEESARHKRKHQPENKCP